MSAGESDFDTGVAPGELEPGRGRPLDTPWGPMALFKVGAELFAVQAFCPHLEGPLHQGSIQGREISCPWHGWRFDLATGERTDFARPRLSASAPLVRCGARVGAGGTIVLQPPAR